MYNITDTNYNSLMHSLNRKFDCKVIINDSNTTLTNDDLYSINIKATSDSNTIIGNTISRQLDLEILNDNMPVIGISSMNVYITIQDIDTDKKVEVFMGTFYASTTSKGKNSTKVTAYDYMSKLNLPYFPSINPILIFFMRQFLNDKL